MHREILGCAANEKVDHRNGNGLDNRRENLRRCTQSENLMNKRMGVNNTSGFKGVSATPRGRWRSYINVYGNRMHIGVFDTPEEAATAYDKKAKKYFKEFAVLNFPLIPGDA